MKKKYFQISDVLLKFEQFDYDLILGILKPFVIGLVSSYAGKILVEKCILSREFKPKKILKVEPSPEKPNEVTPTDLEKRYKKKSWIISIINKIQNQLGHTDLSFFNNNLQTIKINDMNYFEEQIYKYKYGAFYQPWKNIIKLSSSDVYRYNDCHEMLHAASSTIRESDKRAFSGFSQTSASGKKYIGNGINEGYTEILRMRLFPPLFLGTYQVEQHIVSHLEKIVGVEQMEKMYMKADLFGLVNYLKQYMDETDVIKFIKDVDFINANNLTNTKKIKLNELKLKDIYTFLINCYMKKLNADFLNKGINEDEYAQKISEYISTLGSEITDDTVCYNTFDIDTLKEIVKNQLPISKEISIK